MQFVRKLALEKLICDNEQLSYLFDPIKTICKRDNIIIGKQEFIDDFISTTNEEISFKSYYDENGLTHQNVGKTSYKKEIMSEEGFDEAIAFLTKKLEREIEFYNSFDRILNLNAQQYEVVRGQQITR